MVSSHPPWFLWRDYSSNTKVPSLIGEWKTADNTKLGLPWMIPPNFPWDRPSNPPVPYPWKASPPSTPTTRRSRVVSAWARRTMSSWRRANAVGDNDGFTSCAGGEQVREIFRGNAWECTVYTQDNHVYDYLYVFIIYMYTYIYIYMWYGDLYMYVHIIVKYIRIQTYLYNRCTYAYVYI